MSAEARALIEELARASVEVGEAKAEFRRTLQSVQVESHALANKTLFRAVRRQMGAMARLENLLGIEEPIEAHSASRERS